MTKGRSGVAVASAFAATMMAFSCGMLVGSGRYREGVLMGLLGVFQFAMFLLDIKAAKMEAEYAK